MNREHHNIAVILMIGALVMLSCRLPFFSAELPNVIEGSGIVISEQREVQDFDRIQLTGAGDVFITQEGVELVTVESDDNLLPYIETEVRAGTLMLGYTDEVIERSIRPSQTIKYFVSLKDINGLEISGSGDVYSESLNTERLTIQVDGSSDITFEQLTTNQFDIEVNGSSNIQVEQLTAQDVDVTINGSADINLSGLAYEQNINIDGSGNYVAADLNSQLGNVAIYGQGEVSIWAVDILDVHIPGSGTVSYYGDPVISFSNPGQGELDPLGDK
jgi:autotransporter translocation and assembly factor TamB